jgi:D-glycero-alpha-D-manno-heptose-7-phosphate kinase
MPERVEARAPTRIDLAGGTLDLWPLCLLHDRALTLNAAIDLFAVARVETTGDGGLEVISKDRGARFRCASLDDLRAALAEAPAEVEFPMRLAAHFLARLPQEPRRDRRLSCRITTECQAPAGSGLGGSSALGIALAGALDRYVGAGLEGDRLLAVTRAIETQVLRIPTGEQDYHPAVHGGVLALHFTVEGTRVERLPVDLESLRRRTVLVFTGVSRSSGLSNWDMLKRRLEGDRGVRSALDKVALAAHAMRRALLATDWDAAGAALAEEWEARKELSPMVTTPDIDRLVEEARAAGAQGGKICGAGGGGCLVLWVREGSRESVQERLSRAGASVLDFHYVATGAAVTEK